MSRPLEDRPDHLLVMKDGEVQLVPKSPLNVLVYNHGLEGLLVDGDESLHIDRDGHTIEIWAAGDAREFDMVYDEYEFHIAQHEKKHLIETLEEAYENADENGVSIEPFKTFVANRLDTKIVPEDADQFLPFFEQYDVEKHEGDGWLINGHLLLTYDAEFYHPDTTAVNSSGSVVSGGANQKAYNLRMGVGDGQTELGDFHGMSETDAVTEFLSKALWAVTYAPEGVEAIDYE